MKDIVDAYGLRRVAAIYHLDHGTQLILKRIDSKRVVFTTAGDNWDSTELWVSISPTELRLYPRNQENYIEKTIFYNPLSYYDDKGRVGQEMTCAYHRHESFYRELMDWWRKKVTIHPYPELQYIFYMKDCMHDQIASFIQAIYQDVMRHADDKELPYKDLDNRTRETYCEFKSDE